MKKGRSTGVRTVSAMIRHRTLCWAVLIGLLSICRPARSDNPVIVKAGILLEIQVEDRNITVEIQGKSQTFDIATQTKVESDGKPAALSELHVGAKVNVSVDKETGKAVKVAQATPKEPSDGKTAPAEQTSLCDFEVLSAEWRNVYAYEYDREGPSVLGSVPRRLKLAIKPKNAGERLLVATVRCQAVRNLSAADRRVILKTQGGAETLKRLKMFSTDAIIGPSCWLLGTLDEQNKSLDLRAEVFSRKIGGTSTTMVKHLKDESTPPETTIFLSGKGKKHGDATMEIVWSTTANRSLVLAVLPTPAPVAEPAVFRLTFTEDDKLESAKVFEKAEGIDRLLPAK